LSANYSIDNHGVLLSTVSPRNELDILPEALYSYSALPLLQIKNEVGEWKYSQKVDTYEIYLKTLNQNNLKSSTLTNIRYEWDLLTSYLTFLQFQELSRIEEIEGQALTPRYGYDVPELVNDAGLTEQFETCFDFSLKLYSILQDAGNEHEAQYATLLGHKLRWKLSFNGAQAIELLTQLSGNSAHMEVSELVLKMQEKIAEVHPLLADSISTPKKVKA
jgi:hypothetical protein